jgi:hypothetical protein
LRASVDGMPPAADSWLLVAWLDQSGCVRVFCLPAMKDGCLAFGCYIYRTYVLTEHIVKHMGRKQITARVMDVKR